MSIGIGIFLSSLVIAALVLFLKTKDRWNWKRIILWSATVLVAISVVAGGLVYSYSIWEDRPQKQNEFWGINLGDTKQDVIFKKGIASNVVDDQVIDQKSNPDLWTYALNSDGSIISKINEGSTASQLYFVGFRASRVRYVEVVFGDLPNMPNLGGIGSYSTLDDIEKILGQPTYVSRYPDETERYFSFAKYNVAFAFSQGKMKTEAVYDSETGPLKFTEGAK
jgi:hypothetical protein